MSNSIFIPITSCGLTVRVWCWRLEMCEFVRRRVLEFKLILYYFLLRALESNQYNHITATYFLLAERMLREKQEKEQHSQTRSPSPSKAQFRYTHIKAHIHISWDGQIAVSAVLCTVSFRKKSLTADGQTIFFLAESERLTENRREVTDQQHFQGCIKISLGCVFVLLRKCWHFSAIFKYLIYWHWSQNH